MNIIFSTGFFVCKNIQTVNKINQTFEMNSKGFIRLAFDKNDSFIKYLVFSKKEQKNSLHQFEVIF